MIDGLKVLLLITVVLSVGAEVHLASVIQLDF